MSNDGGIRAWVGDLDDYIDINQINRWNDQEAEEKALRDDLDTIGDIALLDGRKTSASKLNARGITPDEWKWAVYEAEKSFSGIEKFCELERALLQGLLAVGRPYAIGRYARWERLTFASARTTVLPFGHLALIDQLLAQLDPKGALEARRSIRAAIKKAEEIEGLVAYERTGMVRSAILQVVDAENLGKTDRECLRLLLSLTRLRFSASETRIHSFDQFRALDNLYAAVRLRSPSATPSASAGLSSIRNWALRHIHPLTFLMPIGIRAALQRGSNHLSPGWQESVTGLPKSARILRLEAVNELALAKCSAILVRRG